MRWALRLPACLADGTQRCKRSSSLWPSTTSPFHASPKTKSGTLESRAGWKGLCRKGETLLIVLVACRLDAVMGSTFVRDAVVIGFICNETISIIENAGLMGLPIPAAITKAVDILKQRSETEQKG